MLAVAGGKGGCGKTTTAVGLALSAARRGQATLAVDADVDVPDLHRVAGVAGPPEAPARPRAVPGSNGAAVLPAAPGSDPDDLDARLARARRYDRVLLDCPAGAGRDAAVPLRAADRTVVVTTDDEASLRDAAKTAAMSRAVGTPVAAAVVTGRERSPGGVPSLLGAPAVEPVPTADRPLASRAVRRGHDRLLRRLGWA